MTPLLCRNYPSPHYRRDRFGRWLWSITDGMTGPTLIAGTALTQWGAHRKLNKAAKCCQRRQWVTRDDRPVLHPLSLVEATAICDDLACEGIRIVIRLGDVVRVCPAAPVTTRQEVHALTAVKDVTDATVIWAGAVA